MTHGWFSVVAGFGGGGGGSAWRKKGSFRRWGRGATARTREEGKGLGGGPGLPPVIPLLPLQTTVASRPSVCMFKGMYASPRSAWDTDGDGNTRAPGSCSLMQPWMWCACLTEGVSHQIYPLSDRLAHQQTSVLCQRVLRLHPSHSLQIILLRVTSTQWHRFRKRKSFKNYQLFQTVARCQV